MDLEELINTVIARVGAVIQKPKMSAKLLNKPPFRFLHDTIMAIINTTGFAEGLYEGAEKESSSITDRQGKTDYLDKIIRLVGICKVCSHCPFLSTMCVLLYNKFTGGTTSD